MVTQQQVCKQITAVYPQLGACSQDISVNWDEENQAWAVDFAIDGQPIRHYLENRDAAACILDRQCVGMGIEFGQFM